jgi:hypothetical protein
MFSGVAQLGWFIIVEASEEHRGTARNPDPTEGQRARDPNVKGAIIQQLLEQMPRSVLTDVG